MAACGSVRLMVGAPPRFVRVGYALAYRDATTLRSEEIAMARWDTLQVDGTPMRVYLDTPAGGGTAPGVVVIQHGPGLDRFIEDRVEDLARHGYVAAAPDLYHRQPQDGADMMTRMGRLRDKEILVDVDATIAHLRSLKDARVGGLAVLGFCMGGRVTHMLAGARPAAWRTAGVF